jgi:hypothetical protein
MIYFGVGPITLPVEKDGRVCPLAPDHSVPAPFVRPRYDRR